jgi:hypothetical protein
MLLRPDPATFRVLPWGHAAGHAPTPPRPRPTTRAWRACSAT